MKICLVAKITTLLHSAPLVRHQAHPTHNTRATHVWTETGKERPLLTVSGRERVNRNAALNAQCPTQVHLDETNCVNAQSAQRLYEKRLIAHPGEHQKVWGNQAERMPTWLAP